MLVLCCYQAELLFQETYACLTMCWQLAVARLTLLNIIYHVSGCITGCVYLMGDSGVFVCECIIYVDSLTPAIHQAFIVLLGK